MSAKTPIPAGPGGRTRVLLIDDTAYSTAVIRQGAPIPWTDTTLTAGHFGQVTALLNPDALWIDIDSVLTAHTDSRPDLVVAMGAKTRVGYPLRTLLTDAGVLDSVREVLATAAKTTRRQLLLHLPSPARWLAGAHATAGNPLGEIDPDRADNASMYVAEWLGQLGSLPVSLVLLDSRGSALPEALAAYTAVTNVTAHFGWPTAMWNDNEIATAAGHPSIGMIDSTFWTDHGVDTPVSGTDMVVTSIPATASPEYVLEQRARLR